MRTIFATFVVVVGVAATTHAQEKTADEIARELANPATPMSSLGNNFEYRDFKGDLPGANGSESFTYSFQPSLPFSLGEGAIFTARPIIPFLVDQPVFDADSGGFKEESGLGDIAFDAIYGKTSPEGLVTLGGLFGVLPTHSEEGLGSDQWRFGPEGLVGMIREWGLLAVLVFHQWDAWGGDDEPSTSLTSAQYIYSINLGQGYQLASGPIVTYDWKADSDQAWTVPLGIGIAKTFIAGKTPIKSQLQLFYNVKEPDALAQDWGIKLSFTPVVKNPFMRK